MTHRKHICTKYNIHLCGKLVLKVVPKLNLHVRKIIYICIIISHKHYMKPGMICGKTCGINKSFTRIIAIPIKY